MVFLAPVSRLVSFLFPPPPPLIVSSIVLLCFRKPGRDPRFDPNCGTLNTRLFRKQYTHIEELAREEENVLAKQVADCKDPIERIALQARLTKTTMARRARVGKWTIGDFFYNPRLQLCVLSFARLHPDACVYSFAVR